MKALPRRFRLSIIIAILLLSAGAVFIALSATRIHSTPPDPPTPGMVRDMRAGGEVMMLAEGARRYQERTGRLPADSYELYRAFLQLGVAERSSQGCIGQPGQLVDPWGTPIAIERHGRRYAIVSAGEDKTFGTPDDIRDFAELEGK